MKKFVPIFIILSFFMTTVSLLLKIKLEYGVTVIFFLSYVVFVMNHLTSLKMNKVVFFSLVLFFFQKIYLVSKYGINEAYNGVAIILVFVFIAIFCTIYFEDELPVDQRYWLKWVELLVKMCLVFMMVDVVIMMLGYNGQVATYFNTPEIKNYRTDLPSGIFIELLKVHWWRAPNSPLFKAQSNSVLSLMGVILFSGKDTFYLKKTNRKLWLAAALFCLAASLTLTSVISAALVVLIVIYLVPKNYFRPAILYFRKLYYLTIPLCVIRGR